MKKNNKGFSLVELIIVIAIMAILAGALAPALIKYINKSRKSTDIQNADSIRTAVQTALSDPNAADDISGTASFTSSNIADGSAGTNCGTVFMTEVKSIVGSNKLTQKYGTNKGSDFIVEVNVSDNTVIVYGGTASNKTQLSPSAMGDWAD